MNLKTLTLKAAGGLFAVGVVATAFLGSSPSARADGGSAPTFSPICIGKPDIRFDRVRVEKVYDQMVAHIHFSNQGCATKTSFPIAVVESGASYTQVIKKNLMQPAMAKGESTVRVVVLGPATSETHYLHVGLDIGPTGADVIDESNEYNNFGNLDFSMP
jgi:CARDB